ncbi:hypothetical protein [Prosthecobacter sp.]|uniref:hypothetical protein n=1 Tax=Prosthecobacter sp. TaxID=1965333 RepID=UPI002487C4E2|nr:hypothetical protein [Prosthecobacter sp.]MDI1311762.1 hypothetical protein [Prosthecobacter sp.]
MMVLLKSLLRWGARLLLPFIGWWVPVQRLRGVARASGREVILLAAGQPRWTDFIIQQLFAAEPRVENCIHVPVWSLQKHLDRAQSAADLTLVGIDRLSAQLFLAQDYLAVPPMVSAWLTVPEEVRTYTRAHSRTDSEFRRVKRQGYTSELSKSAADYELFYDSYYKPYIRDRHKAKAQVAPRWLLRWVFRRGGIQWVTQNGEHVAGDLVIKQSRDYIPVVTGLREGRQELLREGALAALYVHSLEEARHLGCTRILLGGSKPSLHDGVLRYKAKWLDGLTVHDGHLSANHVQLLRWPRLVSPVAEFLSQTALIHHDQDGFSGLWAFPSDLPLTAENLQQQYHALKLKGLHRFRILLPGDVPPGFTCPPEVRLIKLAAAEQVGAGEIKDLG